MPQLLDGEGQLKPIEHGGPVPQGAVVPKDTELVIKSTAAANDSTILRDVRYLEEAQEIKGSMSKSVTGSIKNIYVPIMMAAVAAEFAWSYYHHKKKHEEKDAAYREHKAGKPFDYHCHEVCDSEREKRKAKARSGEAHDEPDLDALDRAHWDQEHKKRTHIDHARKSVKRTAELAIKMAPCAITASLLVIPFIKNALASSHGVMVREEAALENVKKVTHVLSDIRGPLTSGVSEYSGLHIWDHAKGSMSNAAVAIEHAIIGDAAKAQTVSGHEVAGAIKRAADRRGHRDIGLRGAEVAENLNNQGVRGHFAEDHHVLMGNHACFTEAGHDLPQGLVEAAKAHGGDVTFFRHTRGDTTHVGFVHCEQQLRAGAKEAITDLRKKGVKVALVTGMPEQTAQSILRRLDAGGLADNPILLHADCPSTSRGGRIGKDDIVGRYAHKDHMIAAIGDGFNDGAFMQKAKSVGGISMAVNSTGAAVTKDNASMVIEGIHQLPDLMALSKNMGHALWLNVGAAASWMSLLVGSHYAGYHMKTQEASLLHEAPTFLLTLASLGQSLRLTRNFATLGR